MNKFIQTYSSGLASLFLAVFMSMPSDAAQSHRASGGGSLRPGCQVFGLIVGQSLRPGLLSDKARAKDGKDSQELVTSNLRRLASTPADIKLIQQAPNHPMTRQEIIDAVEQFVKYCRQRINPRLESVVFFYYFGHGVANGISGANFLVPNAALDSPAPEDPAKLAEHFVDIAWVKEQLGELSDHVVLLIDACRIYRH
jgi:hypothetical protein